MSRALMLGKVKLVQYPKKAKDLRIRGVFR